MKVNMFTSFHRHLGYPDSIVPMALPDEGSVRNTNTYPISYCSPSDHPSPSPRVLCAYYINKIIIKGQLFCVSLFSVLSKAPSRQCNSGMSHVSLQSRRRLTPLARRNLRTKDIDNNIWMKLSISPPHCLHVHIQ